MPPCPTPSRRERSPSSSWEPSPAGESFPMTPRAWFLFAVSSVVWGVPYLFIKVAVDAGVPPGVIAWARVALGAAVLLPFALRRGLLRGLRGRAGPIAAYAACEIAVP